MGVCDVTRKDYEALAKWLGSWGVALGKEKTEMLAVTLASDVLIPDNPNFDPIRFAKVVGSHVEKNISEMQRS
jgi:hypothetical protein